VIAVGGVLFPFVGADIRDNTGPRQGLEC
jgi:hypothetical protein